MEVLMARRNRDTLGITLIELMIVVVIIGVLAALAVVGYRKYIGQGRLSEPPAILAEFAAKEQLYFLDNGLFLEAHKDTTKPKTEDADQFWPHDPSVNWDSARQPFPVDPLPTSWTTLGIRPRFRQLYCTYLVNAGCGPPDATTGCTAPEGDIGPTVWGAAPNVPWFYAMGACNLQGNAGWPDTGGNNPVTLMILTHDSPSLQKREENQ
jgi:prepilin-type N-terminal cleavage/methylation domain-containing protein